ncbi:MAG: isoprenylcysteine carboxylmethyltransferase family protein [Pseudomonadota bacterium]
MAASLVLFVVFLRISQITLTHFRKGSAAPAYFIVVGLTVAGSFLLAWIGAKVDVPIWPWQLVAMVGGILSIVIMQLAIEPSKGRDFGIVFADEASQSLVRSGIYGRVRNPFYLGYLIYWLAWVPATGFHLLAFGFLFALTVVYTIAARQEEAMLASRFGAEYEVYLAQTGRFLPKLLD